MNAGVDDFFVDARRLFRAFPSSWPETILTIFSSGWSRSPGLIRSGLYPSLKSTPQRKPETFSNSGPQISSVAPGWTVDSKTTMLPGRSTGPMDWQARTSSEKIRVALLVDGRRDGHDEKVASLQVRHLVGKPHRRGKPARRRSISPVQSSPSFRRAIRRLSTSKPMTSKRLENATATGRPTYPEATHCDFLYHRYLTIFRGVADTGRGHSRDSGETPVRYARAHR